MAEQYQPSPKSRPPGFLVSLGYSRPFHWKVGSCKNQAFAGSQTYKASTCDDMGLAWQVKSSRGRVVTVLVLPDLHKPLPIPAAGYYCYCYYYFYYYLKMFCKHKSREHILMVRQLTHQNCNYSWYCCTNHASSQHIRPRPKPKRTGITAKSRNWNQ